MPPAYGGKQPRVVPPRLSLFWAGETKPVLLPVLAPGTLPSHIADTISPLIPQAEFAVLLQGAFRWLALRPA